MPQSWPGHVRHHTVGLKTAPARGDPEHPPEGRATASLGDSPEFWAGLTWAAGLSSPPRGHHDRGAMWASIWWAWRLLPHLPRDRRALRTGSGKRSWETGQICRVTPNLLSLRTSRSPLARSHLLGFEGRGLLRCAELLLSGLASVTVRVVPRAWKAPGHAAAPHTGAPEAL